MRYHHNTKPLMRGQRRSYSLRKGILACLAVITIHQLFNKNKPDGSSEKQQVRRAKEIAQWSAIAGAISNSCKERLENGVKPCVSDLLNFATNTTNGKILPTLRAVQIGACDGDFKQQPGDEFQEIVLASPLVDIILVEAVPNQFERLQKNLEPWRKLRGEKRAGESLVPLNVAMCPDMGNNSTSSGSTSGSSIPFFSASPQFAIDHPDAPHWLKFQLGNAVQDNNIVNQLMSYEKKSAPDGTTNEELLKTVRQKYVSKKDVPCYSPKNILAKGRQHPWSPSTVDILMVDTEGMDDIVVESWLALPDFLPTLLIYEHTHIEKPRREALEKWLKELKYDCKASSPSSWADTICIQQNDVLF